MPEDIHEIGKAFVRLGLALKENRDTGLNEKTLATLLECAPEIISAKPENAAKWSEEKDPLGALILNWISKGDAIPTGIRGTDEIKNALTRLRRNGLIINIGSRAKPIWRLTTDDEQQVVVESIKIKRLSYGNTNHTTRQNTKVMSY